MLRYILFATIFLLFMSCSSTDPVSNNNVYSIELVSPKTGDTYVSSKKLTVEWVNNTPQLSNVVFELLYNTSVIAKSPLTSAPGRNTFEQALSGVTVSGSGYSVRISSAADGTIIASSGLFSITVDGSNTNNVYEPNNTRNTATLVKVGDNQLHSISLSDDDWFAIAVTATDSVELVINTYYGTAFYPYRASELRAGTAMESYQGTTKFTKTISGQTDTLFVRVTKDIPSWSKITGPSSNSHDYYVTLRDLRDQSIGTLETNLTAKTYKEGDTINIVVKNSLDGTLYLYRDESSYKVIVETFEGKAVSYVIPKYTTSGSYYFQFEPQNGAADLTSVIFTITGTSVKDIYEDDNKMINAKILRTGESQTRTLTADDNDNIKIPTVKYRDTRISITTPDSISAYTAIVQGTFVEIDNNLRPSKTSTGYSFLMEYPAPDTIGLILLRPDKRVISSVEYTVSASAVEKQTGIILDSVPLKTKYQFADTISLNPRHKDAFVNEFLFELYSGETRVGTIKEKGSYIDWVIPYNLAGGEYRIKITVLDGNYPDSAFTTQFTVVSAMVKDTVNEPNNDSITATLLKQFNSPINGTVLYGDIDWFSFPVDKQHRYSLSVTPADSSGKVDVELDVPGWNMTYSSGEKVISNVEGDVFVKIYTRPESNGGNYTLQVKRFTYDSLLIFSKPKAGTEFKGGDTLIHSIENTYMLSSDAFEDDIKVYLCKGNKELAQLDNYERNDTIGEKIIIPAGHLSGYDYYFKAVANESSSIHATSAFFTITGVEADSYEPNNSKDSAALLPASFLSGVPVAGTLHKTMYKGSFDIEAKSDVDWYGVKLGPNTSIIVKSSGAKISPDDYGTGFLKAISNTGATEAVIYFQISSDSSKYTLTVMDDAEPNDSRETAVSLPAAMVNSSDTLYRYFTDDDDIDWYSISLAQGSYSVNTKLIDPGSAGSDEADITAYAGETELASGTDSVTFILDADTTVLLKYKPDIFWSDVVTRYSIAIKTVP